MLVSFYLYNFRSRLVNQPKNKLISNSEQLFNATHLSQTSFGIMLPLNLRRKNSISTQMNPGTMDEIRNSKIRTIEIVFDSGASASIENILYGRCKILKDRENKWSTMVGIFNITFRTDLELKFSELKEVDWLVQIKVLKKINNTQWEAPTIIRTKTKGIVRFISDSR